jgi:MYXO-CTERM domain-containing protein
MRKRMLVLLMAGTLGLGAAAPVALAQDPLDPRTEEEDDGSDYGWVGLLGLAGLAGLLGLRRHDNRPVVRNDESSRR